LFTQKPSPQCRSDVHDLRRHTPEAHANVDGQFASVAHWMAWHRPVPVLQVVPSAQGDDGPQPGTHWRAAEHEQGMGSQMWTTGKATQSWSVVHVPGCVLQAPQPNGAPGVVHIDGDWQVGTSLPQQMGWAQP
jgi:hypothetical protein